MGPTHSLQEEEGFRVFAVSTCYKHLQAAMKVHQALSSLHGDLGSFVYLDFDQQGLWFVVGLGHLQSPRHTLKASLELQPKGVSGSSWFLLEAQHAKAWLCLLRKERGKT